MNKILQNRSRNDLMVDKAEKWDSIIEELFILHIKFLPEFFGNFFFYYLFLDLIVNIIFPELVQRVRYSLL